MPRWSIGDKGGSIGEEAIERANRRLLALNARARERGEEETVVLAFEGFELALQSGVVEELGDESRPLLEQLREGLDAATGLDSIAQAQRLLETKGGPLLVQLVGRYFSEQPRYVLMCHGIKVVSRKAKGLASAFAAKGYSDGELLCFGGNFQAQTPEPGNIAGRSGETTSAAAEQDMLNLSATIVQCAGAEDDFTLALNQELLSADGFYYFMTPDGRVINLPKETTSVEFSHGVNSFFREEKGAYFPGTLAGFTIGQDVYNLEYSSNQVGHYVVKGGGYYETKSIAEPNFDGVIMAFPEKNQSGKNVLVLYKFKWPTAIATGKLPEEYIGAGVVQVGNHDWNTFFDFPVKPFEKPGDIIKRIEVADNHAATGTWHNAAITNAMTQNHTGKPEFVYVLKIAELRNAYPEIFSNTLNSNSFTTNEEWETGRVWHSATSLESAYYSYKGKWGIRVQNDANLRALYESENEADKSAYFKTMVETARDFIEETIENCRSVTLANPGGSDPATIKLCLDQLGENEIRDDIAFENRLIIIKKLLSQYWVRDSDEQRLLKLIKFLPENDIDKLFKAMDEDCEVIVGKCILSSGIVVVTNSTELCLWRVLYDGLDDSNFLGIWQHDSRQDLIKTLVQYYPHTTFFKDGVAQLGRAVEEKDLDYINSVVFKNEYHNALKRAWTHVKMTNGNLSFINDTYPQVDVKFNPDGHSLDINQEISLGFFSNTISSNTLPWHAPVFFYDDSKISLLQDFWVGIKPATQNQPPPPPPVASMVVPALVCKYTSDVATAQTTFDVVMTAVDVASIATPMGAAKGLWRTVYYADKISSFASITATATREDHQELSAWANGISALTGAASVADLIQTGIKGAKVLNPNIVNNTTQQLEADVAALHTAMTKVNQNGTTGLNLQAVSPLELDAAKKMVKAHIDDAAKTGISVETKGQLNKISSILENALGLLGTAVANFRKMLVNATKTEELRKLDWLASSSGITFEEIPGQTDIFAKYNGKRVAKLNHNSQTVDAIANGTTAERAEDIVKTNARGDAAIVKKEANNATTYGMHLCGCLDARTAVRTPEGSRPLEAIKAGDRVLSQNAPTDAPEWRRVERLVEGPRTGLVQVATDRGTPLVLTPGHPLRLSDGSMVAAAALVRGDVLLADDGATTRVTEVSPAPAAPTRGLVLEGGAAYYVGSGTALLAATSGTCNYALKKLGFTAEGIGWVEAHFAGRAAELEAFLADLQKGGPDLIDYFKNCGTSDIFAGRARAWEKISDGGIPDFINQPGYMKTLEKVAKYQDEAAAGSSGTVKYYRVQTQHPDSKILTVESNGNLTFNKPDVNLNLSTTNRAHADYYAAEKIAQGNTVEIIEFGVPKSFDIQMKQAAVPQYKSTQNLLNPNGTAPKIVDPLQPGDPFELPGFWNQLVQQNYISGTAKIVN